jgi:hypothetical protein
LFEPVIWAKRELILRFQLVYWGLFPPLRAQDFVVVVRFVVHKEVILAFTLHLDFFSVFSVLLMIWCHIRPRDLCERWRKALVFLLSLHLMFTLLAIVEVWIWIFYVLRLNTASLINRHLVSFLLMVF